MGYVSSTPYLGEGRYLQKSSINWIQIPTSGILRFIQVYCDRNLFINKSPLGSVDPEESPDAAVSRAQEG